MSVPSAPVPPAAADGGAGVPRPAAAVGPALRSLLDGVPAYKPGRPAPADPGQTTYKISSNENPYPPLPQVSEAIAQAAASVNRYPDMGVTGLTAALAEHLDVPPEHVATGTGSVGVLAQLVGITCDPGDEVLYAWRSFEAYPIVVALAGATSVQVPLDREARHDLPLMAEAITERTRLVIVCTPNNPTGPAVRPEELEQFLDAVPSHVLVVIDEAYLEFTTDPTPDALEVYRRHPNVAVLRTFSKAFGLAGLRVGYAVAHEPVATALRKAATPFGVSDLAQHAAVVSLGATEALQERVDALVVERERVLTGLRDLGWPVPDAQGNFVWLPLGERTQEFADVAARAGLTVRPFHPEGVRATVAETEANDRLLQVAADFVH